MVGCPYYYNIIVTYIHIYLHGRPLIMKVVKIIKNWKKLILLCISVIR